MHCLAGHFDTVWDGILEEGRALIKPQRRSNGRGRGGGGDGPETGGVTSSRGMQRGGQTDPSLLQCQKQAAGHGSCRQSCHVCGWLPPSANGRCHRWHRTVIGTPPCTFLSQHRVLTGTVSCAYCHSVVCLLIQHRVLTDTAPCAY